MVLIGKFVFVFPRETWVSFSKESQLQQGCYARPVSSSQTFPAAQTSKTCSEAGESLWTLDFTGTQRHFGLFSSSFLFQILVHLPLPRPPPPQVHWLCCLTYFVTAGCCWHNRWGTTTYLSQDRFASVSAASDCLPACRHGVFLLSCITKALLWLFRSAARSSRATWSESWAHSIGGLRLCVWLEIKRIATVRIHATTTTTKKGGGGWRRG